MYGIKVNYFYYAGTINAPKDGYMTDAGGYRLEFDTFEDALHFLKFWLSEVECIKGKSEYVYAGTYYLNHGEYARPQYIIRKLRGT